MAWSASKAFRQAYSDIIANTCAMDWDADTFKVALYTNSITPDQNVTAANSAFNAGQWATAQEVIDASGWPSGGRSLVSTVNDVGTNGQITLDAADTASANATTTLAANFGCLVYDDTLTTPVADQGFSFHYFGGSQSVTAGTYTVVWHVNGLQRIAM